MRSTTIYTSRYPLILIIAMLSFISPTKGQYQKTKHIDKTYPVHVTTQLKIENKFGKVEVNSWGKQQFDINIQVEGHGRDEKRAQQLLDAITIDILESKSEVSFKTVFDPLKNKKNEGFEVNYTIYMPEENLLSIKNSFGDVLIGDRQNDIDIDVSHGSVKVGDVSGDMDVKIAFGHGSIGHTQHTDATIKYGSLSLEGAEKLDLTQSFSDIEIRFVSDLELQSKYGKIEIVRAEKIDATAQFSGFDIDELTGSIDIEGGYLSDFSIKKLAKTFTRVDLDGKFGSYNISLEKGLHANIEAEFSFADLKYSSDLDIKFNYRVKDSQRVTYRGIIGQGDPNRVIHIDSSYGDVRLKID